MMIANTASLKAIARFGSLHRATCPAVDASASVRATVATTSAGAASIRSTSDASPLRPSSCCRRRRSRCTRNTATVNGVRSACTRAT
jgi:hypothetical protein